MNVKHSTRDRRKRLEATSSFEKPSKVTSSSPVFAWKRLSKAFQGPESPLLSWARSASFILQSRKKTQGELWLGQQAMVVGMEVVYTAVAAPATATATAEGTAEATVEISLGWEADWRGIGLRLGVGALGG